MSHLGRSVAVALFLATVAAGACLMTGVSVGYAVVIGAAVAAGGLTGTAAGLAWYRRYGGAHGGR
jgi:hypothetical protein